MSFVITLYVREGIVMASDSRLSLNSQRRDADVTVVSLSVAQSDSNYKTFLGPNRIGISTYGAADIGGVPLGGYVETFLNEEMTETPVTPETIARGLRDYFRGLTPLPKTFFHVAGYQASDSTLEQQVWTVDVAGDQVARLDTSSQGASWGGESDILARLVQPVGILDSSGAVQSVLPHFGIPFQYFTLQDAIDFAVFALRATIDAIRFQPRPKTVGGPIDILVIKPGSAQWVQRKELTGERA